MTAIDKGEGVRAVGRALEILQAFTAQDFELSATELLGRVSLSRPTLYRLLYTLEEHGYIVSVGDPQRFRLGPAVAHLAHVWTSSLDLAVIAEPVLRRIWSQTGETVALFVPQGSMRLCVAELPSPQPLNFKRGVGYTERVVKGATGRVILANSEVDLAVMKAWAAEASVDPAVLQSELALTRKRGYATSHNELIEGAVAIAVAFFDRTGAVAGSIGVFGPATRLGAARQKEIAGMLVPEANSLSRALGWVGGGVA